MNLQFEVPTFEAHQHAAKIFPGDLPAVNNNERHVAILGVVPFDPSPYDAICDLQAMFLLGEMFRGEGAADPLDQAAKQHEQIVFRISDNLEPVAGRMAPLQSPSAFAALLRTAAQPDWVVYAKRPFAGPAQVLTYLSRYTHRVAIANSRLVSMTEDKVSFLWRDYAHGHRTRTMTLDAHEFLRRFLLHVLPA